MAEHRPFFPRLAGSDPLLQALVSARVDRKELLALQRHGMDAALHNAEQREAALQIALRRQILHGVSARVVRSVEEGVGDDAAVQVVAFARTDGTVEILQAERWRPEDTHTHAAPSTTYTSKRSWLERMTEQRGVDRERLRRELFADFPSLPPPEPPRFQEPRLAPSTLRRLRDLDAAAMHAFLGQDLAKEIRPARKPPRTPSEDELREAADPATAPERLVALRCTWFCSALELVVLRNPSFPVAELLPALKQGPWEPWLNPLVPLLAMEGVLPLADREAALRRWLQFLKSSVPPPWPVQVMRLLDDPCASLRGLWGVAGWFVREHERLRPPRMGPAEYLVERRALLEVFRVVLGLKEPSAK